MARFLPHLLAALAILVTGVVLAATSQAIARRVLSWIRFDQIIERVGAGELLLNVLLTPPHVAVAKAVYWLTWMAVALSALGTLGVAGTDVLVADFVRFLPRLVAVVLVLILGICSPGVAWRAALLAAVSAGLQAAKLLGSAVRMLVIVAAVAMAFEQIDIGHGVLLTAFAIVFGAAMLAMAIAFGLGGRNSARLFLERTLLARNKELERDEASHI